MNHSYYGALRRPKIIHGFEEHLATLKRLVVRQKSDKDDEFKAIDIVETKVIGKTSLCAVVFDNKKVKKRFLPRVLVSMPTPSDEMQKEPQETDSQTDLILARSGRRELASKSLWRNSDSDENYRDLDLGINDHDWKTNNYRTTHALGSIPVIPLEKLGCNMRTESRLQESILLKEIESQFQSIGNTVGNSRAVIAYGF
ncbi:hypothetical protein F8388_004234 [Cannabis sativa]|uniref:Uncharacterized protein n=1 Tax=Cannabis sativa TaxID=3483 RepID=A0A7J6F9Y4_CANSA|nr:hypothetical protein F8388_004234 [Cannabis sativa]